MQVKGELQQDPELLYEPWIAGCFGAGDPGGVLGPLAARGDGSEEDFVGYAVLQQRPAPGTAQGQGHPAGVMCRGRESRLEAVNYEILQAAVYTLVYFQSVALLFVLI